MKNIKFLFLALATLVAGAFTACQEDWTPGPVDSVQSVYLPVDVNDIAFAVTDNAETTDIDETRVARYPVYRQNAGEEMVVAFRSRMVEDDMAFILAYDETTGEPTETLPLTEAFVIDEFVTFAAGETVAYLNVTLDERMVGRLSVGATYAAEIMVKESVHQGNYGLYRKMVNIGIPETWKSANINGEKDNEGMLFDDFVSSTLYGQPAGNGAPVIIEESEARKGYYRLVNPYSQENAVLFIGGVPSDMSFAPGNTYLEIDARDPKNVFIPFQYTGITVDGFGQVWIGMATNEKGKIGVLEDGIITFPAGTCIVLCDETGSGYYSNQSGLFKIVLPGVSLVDHSMSVAYVGSETAVDNTYTNAILNFAVGADVSKYRFAVVQGDHPITTKVSAGIGKFEDQYHEAILNLIDDEYEPTEDDTMAEATPSQTTWFVSFDESDVYTVFAVPYNKEGEPVMENIASTFFYYRAAGSTTEVPEMSDMEVEFGAVADVMGNPAYEQTYNSSYILCLNLAQEKGKYLSAVAHYFGSTADIDAALAAGETFESLLSSNGAQNISDSISEIAAGSFNPVLFNNLTPDTEYSVIVGTTNIYGKSAYYRADAKTAPYRGVVNLGIYEFTDGNSKMQIKFKPFFNVNYGQMYLISWVGDEVIAADGEPMEVTFVTYTHADYNTLACHGQSLDLGGNALFDTPLDYYNGDKNKFWGYRSSATADFEYANEALVIKYDNNGDIVGLETYFQKFLTYQEEVTNKDGEKEFVTKEEILLNFDPATTTVKLIESHMPEPEQPATFSAPRKSASKIGVYNGTIELKANVNASVNAAVSIK